MIDYFAGRISERYDERTSRLPVEPIVDVLVALAGEGPVLELGIGTGRIALPLAARGVRVSGIDLSTDMVAQLRQKPGADDIDVTVGDFATTRVEGTFTLAYVVFNTIMNLTSQDAQVACFQNVADHLGSGGRFVVEVATPPLQGLPRGETFQVFDVSPTHLGFDEIGVADQTLVSHHYWFDGDQVERSSPPFRYVWPSELDLMARLAGMQLRERWGDWHREPFTSESSRHVSVWEKPL